MSDRLSKYATVELGGSNKGNNNNNKVEQVHVCVYV